MAVPLNKYEFVVRSCFLALISLLLMSCGSSDVVQNISAEERFEMGKKKFDDGDYLDAINEFEIIKLQYTGSAVADDAQYYLAECHYMKEEYLLAAEEYQSLKRNMPASPFIPLAYYKTAMCFYNLSPRSDLDQRYTARAIDEFQAFIEYNPTHELVTDADAKIKELNTRLSKKLYDTAVLYMKMEYYKAATQYFANVIEKYHDTEFAEPALFGRAEAYYSRKKYEEARKDIEKFLERYPSSELKYKAEALRDRILDRLKSQSAAVGIEQTLSGTTA